jgi:hypothetical protein
MLHDKQNSNYLDYNQNLIMRSSTPRWTDWLTDWPTVSCKVTLNLTHCISSEVVRRTLRKCLNVKVNLFLCFFNWAPRHERVLGKWRYSSIHSLTWALDEGEWSALRSGSFTRRERAPGTHWIGGWVGPRAVLDAVEKRKIHSPSRESKSRTPIVQPVV